MAEVYLEYSFEQEIREIPEFTALNRDQQFAIMQVMQDSTNSEEHLKMLDESQIPKPLIQKIEKLKDRSTLLSKISQNPIDFNAIKFLFSKLSKGLDKSTIEICKPVSVLYF